MFAVADGMGGHAAGEVASRVAIEVLGRGGRHPASAENARKWLASQVETANRAVYDAARATPELRGMGTTLTAVYLRPPHACYAHVGDSRLYLFRNGRLQQLTRDHTWVQEQIDAGLLTPERAVGHPHRSVLTRAVGISESVEVDSADVDLAPGDMLLLASDGLTAMSPDDEIASVLARPASLDAIADALIEDANARGGHDNITVVLIRVD